MDFSVHFRPRIVILNRTLSEFPQANPGLIIHFLGMAWSDQWVLDISRTQDYGGRDMGL